MDLDDPLGLLDDSLFSLDDSLADQFISISMDLDFMLDDQLEVREVPFYEFLFYFIYFACLSPL